MVDHLAFMAKVLFSVSLKDDHPRSRKFSYWPTLIDTKLFPSQDKKNLTLTSTRLSYHIVLR